MRKSLGNKRKEICDSQREEITRLYGNSKEGEQVKIFDNSDFGYRRITVERPLKLNFEFSDERIKRLEESEQFKNLAASRKRKDKKQAKADIAEGTKLQQIIIAALRTLKNKGLIKNRETFLQTLEKAFKKTDIKYQAPLMKALIKALSERDETADICLDSKGNPEPDTDLRDYEDVPLKEDIHKYFKREVLPHVPDAWIDESKTKTGYEINFNRYFYKYVPPRPLEDIENDLKQIENEISGMLKGAIK